jgi:hypothetical protein
VEDGTRGEAPGAESGECAFVDVCESAANWRSRRPVSHAKLGKDQVGPVILFVRREGRVAVFDASTR